MDEIINLISQSNDVIDVNSTNANKVANNVNVNTNLIMIKKNIEMNFKMVDELFK